MDLVLFARPELLDVDQLFQLKMQCLMDRHVIVKEFLNGEERCDSIKRYSLSHPERLRPEVGE